MALPCVILVGGGHAQLAVLADWIRHGRPPCDAKLVNPEVHLRYSGIVPGLISGEYQKEDGLIDLAALAAAAGVTFIAQPVVALDTKAQCLALGDGRQLAFDHCSINIGGVGRSAQILGDDPRLLDIRPIGKFVSRLSPFFDPAGQRSADPAPQIAVIGGGAGGVELAFALRNAAWFQQPVSVQLVAGDEGILPGFGAMARAKVTAELERQNIVVNTRNAHILQGKLFAGDVALEPVDLIVAALGSAAPSWPGAAGLTVDIGGFVMVDCYQRSISHPNIFAAGDIAVRTDRHVAHSGVHAVHAGPVLAKNLRAVITGQAPRHFYTPRPASLYLLSTGNRSAILVYGRFAARGHWVWRLKRWIDKRWVRAYARLAGRL